MGNNNYLLTSKYKIKKHIRLLEISCCCFMRVLILSASSFMTNSFNFLVITSYLIAVDKLVAISQKTYMASLKRVIYLYLCDTLLINPKYYECMFRKMTESSSSKDNLCHHSNHPDSL